MHMKKLIYISIGVIAVLVISIVVFNKVTGGESSEYLKVEVIRGDFEILVTTTGELQAENSEDITAPQKLRTSRHLRFGQIKIQDLIPEGTVVEKGEYVATLDRSDALNRLKDIEDELEKKQSSYTKTRLDTTIQLRNLRDELINLEFAVEEKEIVLEQSKFEPPATIRQAKIDLDKAQRAFLQATKNYKLKVQQAEADMREAEINFAKEQRSKDEMQGIINKFVIHAPSPGMVIYKKEWGGKKREVGSMISPWDLTVATLPDLSSMISRTYVNEIDISKIKVGQEVRIGVDAFPEKEYTGNITDVANIGEQLPNTDAKVFEIVIQINESDPILRPSMTTSNKIITATFDDTLFVPLETIQSDDSIPFVYTTKSVKQIVVLGPSNENEVIIEHGLEEGDEIYLTVPDDKENFKLRGEELIEIIEKKKEQKRKEEEARKAENGKNLKMNDQMKQFEGFGKGMSKEQMEKMRKSMGKGDIRIEKKLPEDEKSSKQVIVKKEDK
jgi:multidrug efflux pump subunit AcrA (membrane-fusion protein)